MVNDVQETGVQWPSPSLENGFDGFTLQDVCLMLL